MTNQYIPKGCKLILNKEKEIEKEAENDTYTTDELLKMAANLQSGKPIKFELEGIPYTLEGSPKDFSLARTDFDVIGGLTLAELVGGNLKIRNKDQWRLFANQLAAAGKSEGLSDEEWANAYNYDEEWLANYGYKPGKPRMGD